MRRHETTLECEKLKDFSGSLSEVYMCQGLMIHMFTEFQYVSFFLHSMRLQMAYDGIIFGSMCEKFSDFEY